MKAPMNITIKNLHIYPASSGLQDAFIRNLVRVDDDEHEANGVTPGPAAAPAMGINKCYSTDGEEFGYSSFEAMTDALGSYGELEEGCVYWASDCTPLTPTDATRHIDASSLIEQMECGLADEIGDCAMEVFSDVEPDALAELNALLLAWVAKHADIGRFWKLTGMARECKLTAEDLA